MYYFTWCSSGRNNSEAIVMFNKLFQNLVYNLYDFLVIKRIIFVRPLCLLANKFSFNISNCLLILVIAVVLMLII